LRMAGELRLRMRHARHQRHGYSNESRAARKRGQGVALICLIPACPRALSRPRLIDNQGICAVDTSSCYQRCRGRAACERDRESPAFAPVHAVPVGTRDRTGFERLIRPRTRGGCDGRPVNRCARAGRLPAGRRHEVDPLLASRARFSSGGANHAWRNPQRQPIGIAFNQTIHGFTSKGTAFTTSLSLIRAFQQSNGLSKSAPAVCHHNRLAP